VCCRAQGEANLQEKFILDVEDLLGAIWRVGNVQLERKEGEGGRECAVRFEV
jgi:hypothetical protein